MSTLGRGGSALLVIDVQKGVVESAFERDEKIANMNRAVAKAREAGVPVVWVQHSDEELVLESDGWQIVDELKPAEGEAKVRKLYPSSFEATNLEEVLAGLGADHIYVCGAESNNCVRHTSHAGLERGYDVTLILDAHTTTGFTWNGYTVDAARTIDEQNTNFMGRQLPGRAANAVSSVDLKF